ncbi:MAG TPA: iron ABC transporter permease [Gammaproteobacteria bacterium]|nr:iron ABC transporter permease [Gammaproteobacteria bacterium]
MSQRPLQQRSLIPGLLILTGASILCSLFIGSASLSPSQVFNTLLGNGTALEQTLVFDLRLPRTLVAFVTGALLSIAGVLMQVLLRNPLADPYVLGISGGASLAALISMALGFSTTLITSGAFSGALLSMFLVFILAKGPGGRSVNRLLLTGVVLAAGWGALISFLLVISPTEKIYSMLFWLMGDLSYDRPLLPGFIILLLGILLTVPLYGQLNIMIWGEKQASSLGINIQRLRLTIFFLASFLTAGAVTIAGGIGFVGLIVPHFVRMLVGNDHKKLIPASALCGATLLIFADIIARWAFAPLQLPVGVITALIGVPVFLYLLRQSR